MFIYSPSAWISQNSGHYLNIILIQNFRAQTAEQFDSSFHFLLDFRFAGFLFLPENFGIFHDLRHIFRHFFPVGKSFISITAQIDIIGKDHLSAVIQPQYFIAQFPDRTV